MPPLIALLASLATTAPATVTLSGRPAPAEVLASSVVMFWRSDCAPCLNELADIDALRRAASPLRVRPVNLDGDGGAAMRRAMDKVGLHDEEGLRAPGDPAVTLAAYGGSPPRLPLAVAFDGAGRACGRRTGFLGYEHLRAWAAACGDARAARR